jgi:hypothetical protein
MVDSQRLLADLTRLLAVLEGDLRQQVKDHPDARARLQADYEAARRVRRTYDTFETWSEEPITQAAVAWILGTVFVRFLEDNALVDPMLSGVEARYTRAQHEHQHYFHQHPTHSERDYLEHLFGKLAAIPATAALFDRRHNPVWRLPLSADGARALVEFWQIDPDLGRVTHDFTDQALDTRFLGDLYQDLSEPVRKRYALLQTPRFVADFILDRTLTPAIETFGYREVRLMDPTCGSGHFLLDAFDRLLALGQEHEPGREVRVRVQDVLSRIVGVDVNPYAVAIATFRLTVASLRACNIARLLEAPGLDVSVVTADALLHGPRFADDGAIQMSVLPDDPANQYYFAEDEVRVKALLGRQYHAVVGNPPYITVKDAALRALYRARYGSCSGKYALVVPFMERFFELALPPDGDDATRAGYVGLIVADSFMKREFGKKLIEEYVSGWDLTHVVSTSGAFIPGHSTPTAIVFGRHRRPQLETVRAVMGIRGEPNTPEDPAKGLVWTAILDQIDRPDSESAYVSVADTHRTSFHKHPWSIGGGGAAELKDALDEAGSRTLGDLADSIGIASFTLEDDVYLLPRSAATRRRLEPELTRAMLTGDELRDWSTGESDVAVFPYDSSFLPVDIERYPGAYRYLWFGKTDLANNKMFGGKTKVEAGLRWYEFGRLTADKLRTPLTIAFAEVTTHNHFVLDRGGKVFNQTAPVIKLPAATTEEDHLRLLGLLNSSTACFWLKQACFCKGLGGQGGGIKPEAWHRAYAFNASRLSEYPIPEVSSDVIAATRRLVDLSDRRENFRPAAVLDKGVARASQSLLHARGEFERLTKEMVGEQERLDWLVYQHYGLVSKEEGKLPPRLSLEPEERPSEFLLKRRMASGEPSIFYEVHRYRGTAGTRTEDTDTHRWLKHAVDLIERNPSIRLIEKEDFKRRWQETPWEGQCQKALKTWMLDRLEAAFRASSTAKTVSVASLSDTVRTDEEFWSAAEAYRPGNDFDLTRLVDELVRDEAVPFLSVLRYSESGLRKREQWGRTWELQRQEDAGVKAGDIPIPPKYASADFQSGPFWRLRGKLDVPKERFVSYPGCERAADGSLPIAWAGWDHAQQSRALGAYYMQIKTEEGTVSQKLVPLLAGLLELLPWVRQWHGGTDPEFGLDLGEYYADFVDAEARALGMTVDQVRVWKPANRTRTPRRRGQA